MKKHLLFIMLLVLSFSCKTKQLETEIVNTVNINDSLRYIIDQRDSIINDALTTIAEVASSLDEVKRQEGIVTQSVEYGASSKDQIKEDLQVLSSLLSKNRRRIASLEKSTEQLKSANIRIDGLTTLITQLTDQINEKDATINSMLANIGSLNQEVTILNSKVNELEDDKDMLEGVVIEKTNNLNQAYYIVASEKELIERCILEKKGAIGRTLVVNPNLDKEQLILIDIRNIDRIDVKGAKVQIIGSFSTDSYILESGDGRNVVDALIIKDKDKFWANDRILVISYK